MEDHLALFIPWQVKLLTGAINIFIDSTVKVVYMALQATTYSSEDSAGLSTHAPSDDLKKGSTPPTDIMGNTITQSSTPLDSTNQTSMALESILYKH